MQYAPPHMVEDLPQDYYYPWQNTTNNPERFTRLLTWSRGFHLDR